MKKHTLLLACAMRILLNLIALPSRGADDTEIPSSNIAAKPPPSFLIPNSSFLIRVELSSTIKGRSAPRANSEPIKGHIL